MNQYESLKMELNKSKELINEYESRSKSYPVEYYNTTDTWKNLMKKLSLLYNSIQVPEEYAELIDQFNNFNRNIMQPMINKNEKEIEKLKDTIYENEELLELSNHKIAELEKVNSTLEAQLKQCNTPTPRRKSKKVIQSHELERQINILENEIKEKDVLIFNYEKTLQDFIQKAPQTEIPQFMYQKNTESIGEQLAKLNQYTQEIENLRETNLTLVSELDDKRTKESELYEIKLNYREMEEKNRQLNEKIEKLQQKQVASEIERMKYKYEIEIEELRKEFSKLQVLNNYNVNENNIIKREKEKYVQENLSLMNSISREEKEYNKIVNKIKQFSDIYTNIDNKQNIHFYIDLILNETKLLINNVPNIEKSRSYSDNLKFQSLENKFNEIANEEELNQVIVLLFEIFKSDLEFKNRLMNFISKYNDQNISTLSNENLEQQIIKIINEKENKIKEMEELTDKLEIK